VYGSPDQTAYCVCGVAVAVAPVAMAAKPPRVAGGNRFSGPSSMYLRSVPTSALYSPLPTCRVVDEAPMAEFEIPG